VRVWRRIVKGAYWDFQVDDEENRMKKRSGWEFQIPSKIENTPIHSGAGRRVCY